MTEERYQLVYEKIISLYPEDAGSVSEISFLMMELKSLIAVVEDYKYDLNSTPDQVQKAEFLEEMIKKSLRELILQTETLSFCAAIEEQLGHN